MRVIGGRYRRRNLRSPPSREVRPTSDRLRETLFGVLQARVEGSRFLDLCAGTGAVGVEALSRGAAHATFVDRSRKMCGLIETNLDLCTIPEEDTEVVMSEAAEFLRRAASRGYAAWDIVFFDPPYAADYMDVLEVCGSGSVPLSEDGIVIVEHYHKNELKDIVGYLRRYRTLRQSDSCLSFYEQQTDKRSA